MATKFLLLKSFLAFFLCIFLSFPAGAYEINSADIPELVGASIIDFSGQTHGSYSQIVIDGVTFTGTEGIGDLRISSEYSGMYGMTGTHLDNNQGNIITMRVDFSSTTDIFGFRWGAHNDPWTLTAYDASNQVLESRVLPLVDNLTSFYGLATPGIKYFTITQLASYDWILFDDLYYFGSSALSFEESPNTPNQSAILEHLNGQLGSASGEFLSDLVILAGLPDGEFQDALDALSPEPYIGLRDAGLRVVRSGTATVTERLQSLYLAQMAGIDPNELYAASNAVMSDAPPAVVSSGKDGFSLWVKPYLYVADQDGDDSYFGYTHDYVGLSVGADYRFAEHFLVGLLAGYADGSVDYDTVDAETDMESTYVGLYGAALLDDFYLHAQATWFMHDFDTARDLDFIGSVATSDHDADEFAASLGCEYLGFQPGGWNVVPGLAVEYSYYDEEGFKESGAGSFNLKGDSVDYDSLASRLGLRINKKFDLTGGAFIPEFRAAWVHEFGDTDRDITARFAGSEDDTFTVDGVEPERDSFIVGLGANFVGDTMAVYVNYDNELADDFWGWGVSAGIKYSF